MTVEQLRDGDLFGRGPRAPFGADACPNLTRHRLDFFESSETTYQDQKR